MDELNAKYRQAAIIITAEIIIVIVLMAVAWFGIFSFESTASASTVTALWVAIIFAAVGSFILRRVFFNWEKLTNTVLLKGISGLISHLRLNAIILSTFAVVIAIIGFIITAFTGDGYQMLRATAIALIVNLINFPRRRVWEQIVGKLEKLDARG